MYIELIGLPGAGKTTLVNRLLSSTELDGRLVNMADYKPKILRGTSWKFRFVFFFLFFSPSIVFYVLKRSNSKKKSFKRIVALFVLLFVMKKFDKKKYILIMDQSILQMLISIAIYNNRGVEYDIENLFNKCLDIIGIDYKSYMKIGVEVPMEEAIARIKSRPKSDCEFKTMDVEQRDRVLQKYTYYFSKVNHDFVCYTTDLPDVNVQKIK